MRVIYSAKAWEEQMTLLHNDPKLSIKLAELINDARRSPFIGLGKPEPLKGEWQGWWSRRLTQEHRLVYRVAGSGAEQHIEVARCLGHY